MRETNCDSSIEIKFIKINKTEGSTFANNSQIYKQIFMPTTFYLDSDVYKS